MSVAVSEDDPEERGSTLDDTSLALRVADFVKRARNHASGFYEEAKESYAFVAGDQWSADDAQKLREQERPPITFNRVGPMVQAVAGAEVNNRQEIKVFPRGVGGTQAEEKANGATLLLRWSRQQAEAEDEESNAFLDAMVCGMGWIETRMDYGDRPEGMIVKERFDPAEALWCPAARKKNLADARELARVRSWRLDDAVAAWPEHADALRSARPALEGGGTLAWQSRNPYEDEGGEDTADRDPRVPTVEIAHYQWCEMKPVVVYDEGGTRAEMPSKDWAKAVKAATLLGRPVPPHAKVQRRVWMHAFIAGNIVLERGVAPGGGKMPTLRCITGMLDRNTGLYYGIVRAMKDPQRWANKWLAQALHYVNQNGRGGVIAEEGAIPDVKAFNETYAKPGSTTFVAPGALSQGMIKPKDPPIFPQAFDRLLQFAIGAIPDVTGINREMLGLSDRDQPGILEAQRKQAAQAILAPLFDSLRRYRKGDARLTLDFIREYVPPGDMIRVLDDDGAANFVAAGMIADLTDFDIIVDEAPTSPNQRAEVWQTLAPMLPAIMKMGLPLDVWLSLLKFSPLPASVVQDIGKALRAGQQQQPAPDPAMMKAQADIQAKQMTTQADIAATQAKTQADIEAKRMSAAADIMLRALKTGGMPPDGMAGGWMN